MRNVRTAISGRHFGGEAAYALVLRIPGSRIWGGTSMCMLWWPVVC